MTVRSRKQSRSPVLRTPIQSAPVVRDDQIDTGGAHRNGSGVEAAQSRCSSLTGLARQMCYASLYGISV
jgi:hypothetical protein